MVDRVSRFYDVNALEAVMDGIVLDLSTEESTAASRRLCRPLCARDPIKPEVTVEPTYDPVREVRSLHIKRRHHGNVKVSVIDEDFQLTADYKQLVVHRRYVQGADWARAR